MNNICASKALEIHQEMVMYLLDGNCVASQLTIGALTVVSFMTILAILIHFVTRESI